MSSHIHQNEYEAGETRTVIARSAWSPAQLVAGIVGLFLTVYGAVVMLRAGFESLTGSSAQVLGVEGTLLMGIIHLFAGVLFLGAAGSALGSRSGLTTLGLAALAFGLVYAIEDEALAPALGGDGRIGWLYVVVGAVALIAAWVSPTRYMRRAETAVMVETESDQADRI